MARGEACKVCFPKGEKHAVFDICLPRDCGADPAGVARVKKCRNCGTEKPWRTRYSAKRADRQAKFDRTLRAVLAA